MGGVETTKSRLLPPLHFRLDSEGLYDELMSPNKDERHSNCFFIDQWYSIHYTFLLFFMEKASFGLIPFMKELTSIYHRQIDQERQAAELIVATLKKHAVPFSRHNFSTTVPHFISSELTVDGKKIKSIPTSFVSGKIHGKDMIVSSLHASDVEEDNINFNPQCDGAISRSMHYFHPALAIHRKDVGKVAVGKKVKGSVKVRATKHRSVNILIGNKKNPRVILFCHYDSIGPGAIDNASGTAVLLKIGIDNPDLLAHTLLVIGGNEELSYDNPWYWGRGYRAFEKTYYQQMNKARAIYAVDCVGNGKTIVARNLDLVRQGFPIDNLEKWIAKTGMVCGDFHKLMEIYHSDADTMAGVSPRWMAEAYQFVCALLKK